MPTAHVNDASLHCEIFGEPTSPTVVMSNSIGTNTALWNPIVSELARTHQVICYDSRGHGRSTTPPGEYTLSDLAGDIAGILDAVSVDHASVVGLSIGGQVALTFALEYPERTDRIVVSNTGAKIGTLESWSERAEVVRSQGLGVIVDKVIAGWLIPEYATANPQLHATLRAWFLGNDPEGYAATCNALAYGDLRPDLEKITAPTLVIGATDDMPTPPALTHQIVEGIPGATWAEVRGAHLSVLEDPAAYLAAVRTHLT